MNKMLAAGIFASAAATAQAQTEVPFALDWKFEGPSAPYFTAIDNGHFAEQGLEVEISAGSGSLDAIPKIASGAFPIGFADLNGLIRFLDQNPGAPVIAVMMIYDKPPFAMIGRRSQGVAAPKDIEGKVLGAPPPDAAWAQFPVFAEANGIDVDAVTVEAVGFPTREPMLAEGKVDAVMGFSFSSQINLERLGVPEDDIAVVLMADHGLELYGNAIIVNTDFAEENPETVTAFLTAVAAGWRDAIADPAAAAANIQPRNPAIDVDLEAKRLQLAIDANVATPAALANGMGAVDPGRLARAIDQLKVTYEFQNDPTPELYFTDAYLPPASARMLK